MHAQQELPSCLMDSIVTTARTMFLTADNLGSAKFVILSHFSCRPNHEENKECRQLTRSRQLRSYHSMFDVYLPEAII